MRWITLLLIFVYSTSGMALCTTADTANLRRGPGKKHKVSWVVGKYMPLLKVGYKRGWYKVIDVDGVKHWVSQSMVSKRIKCIVVSVNKANMRTGPGTQFNYAAYKTADRYTPFKRITKKDSWYQVIDASGNKMWVHENVVWRPVKVSRFNY